MRETAPGAVRMMANRLLDTNLRQGTDRAIGAHYSYLCPSPHEYKWQWFWDSCFQAIAIAHIDSEQAKSELRTLLAAQDDDGFIGHITFWGAKLRGLTHPSAYGQSRPGERLTHSALIQPPMLAQAVERVAEIAHDPAFAPPLMAALDNYHNWLAQNRAPDADGLLVIVSPYESGADQSPTFDEAMGIRGRAGRWRLGFKDRWLDLRNWLNDYDPTKMLDAGHFHVKDSMVNALYADSLATMARLHRRQGNDQSAAAYAGLASHVTDSMLIKMLDRSDAIFRSLIGREERRSEPLTVLGLVPLILEGIPREVAADIAERQLRSHDRFSLRYPAPSVAASEPSFDPRGTGLIWRGPTWVNTNWLLWRGLHRHGEAELAGQLADATIAMVAQAGLREFYNPHSGQGLGAESFGWSALALDMAESS